MRKMNVVCRRNLIFRFQNGLLVMLLMSFWLMFYMLSYKTFTKQAQKDVIDEKVNFSDIISSKVAQAHHKHIPATNVSSSKTPIRRVLDVNEIQCRIEEYNKLQTVLNENIFGPLQNDSLVIVIQVHNRLTYLKHSILSFAQAKGIENALLVFSHDYYDEDINEIIKSITFCKVIQIFYPYSIQTHPNEFPGESKNDCPKLIDMKEAIEKKCTNALHPDLYGHYREAKITQIKHHWWWKANRVFNGLNITKNYTGLMVFFEEDHYVAPDFIHMLHQMDSARRTNCPECRTLSLGTHSEYVDFAADSNTADIKSWSTGMDNMGMTFNRSIWQEMKSCAKTFCTFDDYNWDWTLRHVSSTCFPKEVTTMVLRAPRVFHIGECGIHFKNGCKSNELLKKVQKILKASTPYLYPQDLQLVYPAAKLNKLTFKGNGGWGDIRDHNLCLRMADQS